MVSHAHMSRERGELDMTYPQPSHFASPPMDPALEMDLSPESYSAYSQPPRDAYQTTMSYDSSAIYAAEPPYMYNAGPTSPTVYADDSDMRVPSSDLSTVSASSSNMGSPASHHGQLAQMPEWAAPHGLGLISPGIVDQNEYFSGHDYSFGNSIDGYNAQFEFAQPKGPGFVDPSLIHPMHPTPVHGRMTGIAKGAANLMRAVHTPFYDSSDSEHISNTMTMPFEQQQQHHQFAPPNQVYPGSPGLSPSPQLRDGSTSPFIQHSHYAQFSPYSAPVNQQRRPSLVSYHSNYSGEQTLSGDESKEKQRCPHPDCGRTFKDLKAHMLTHQTERPEKCPIQTCDYHVKGFARKYDKNRHTLTHYKGTMVCGFCPGSGSAAEKSFNRADVFKRHLTAVHGVEQTPPNSRKKTAGGAAKSLAGYAPDATGKCSTCSATFSNAQDFYEHLDDCVLRIVQQEDPAEAINARRLAEVENDRDVHSTLEKNNLPTTTMVAATEEDDDDMLLAGDEGDDEEFKIKTSGSPPSKKSKGNPANGVQKSKGLTHSRGGVPLPTGKSRGRKNRRDYPSSWGFDKGQMTMKKRVMAVFDGPRRLAKDDMMLSTDHEVRVPLQDGKSYVTDLDIQTIKRAHGFHGATEEEKGPWVSDDPTEEQLKKMFECSSPQITVQQ